MITIDPTTAAALIVKQYDTQLQAHLDAAARAAGYDDIRSAITYAEEPAVPKFQAEGCAFRAWRSLFWLAANDVKNAVLAGQRPAPTIAELLAELPTLTLPDDT